MAEKVEIFVGFAATNSWCLFLLVAQAVSGESSSLAAQAQAINRVYFTYFSYLRNFLHSDFFIGFHSVIQEF